MKKVLHIYTNRYLLSIEKGIVQLGKDIQWFSNKTIRLK